jgi:hypothetical protein
MAKIYIWDGVTLIEGADWNVMQEVVENIISGHRHDGVDSREADLPRLLVLGTEIIDKDLIFGNIAGVVGGLKPVKDLGGNLGEFDLRWLIVHTKELGLLFSSDDRFYWLAGGDNELSLLSYDGVDWRNPIFTFDKYGTAYFGLLKDVNLYRSDADILKTDDAFNADSLQIGDTEVISNERVLDNVEGDASIITSGVMDIARLPIRAKRVTDTTDGSGLLSVTFDTPFPNSCTSVVLTKEGADGSYVKLNAQPSKTGFVVRALKGAHTHTPSSANVYSGGGVVSQTSFTTTTVRTGGGVVTSPSGSTIVPIGLKASATTLTWYTDAAYPTASVWIQTLGATTGATLYGSDHTHTITQSSFTTTTVYKSGGVVSQTSFTTTSVVTAIGVGNEDVLANTEITFDYIAIGA